jgi:hypothetical protein
VPDEWLSDISPASDRLISEEFDKGTLRIRSTRGLINSEQDAANESTLAPLQFSPQFFAAIDLVIMIGVVASLRVRVQRYVTGLVAAGMPRSHAMRILEQAAVIIIAAGTIGGLLAATASIQIFAERAGSVFGQSWLRASVPTVLLVGFLLGLAAAVYLLIVLGVAVFGRERRSVFLGGVRVGAGLVVACLGGGALALWKADGKSVVGVEAALGGGLLLALAAPLVAQVLRHRHTVTAVKRTIRTFSVTMTGVAVVLAGMIFLTSFFTLRLGPAGPSGMAATETQQPSGSLVMDVVSDTDAAIIARNYQELGGRGFWQLDLPQEATAALRAVSPDVVDCLTRVRQPDLTSANDCPLGASLTPINRVALVDPAVLTAISVPAGTVLADPTLIVNGKVGVLDVDVSGEGGPIRRSRKIDATPWPILGGLMPGLAVTSESPLANEFHLRPSRSAALVLSDVIRFPGPDRAQLRGTIAAVANYAAASEDLGQHDDGGAALSLMVASVGTLLIVVLLLATGNAFNTGNRVFRGLLFELGVRRRRRFLLGLRLYSIPAFAAMTAILISLLASWRLDSVSAVSHSVVWALPALGTLAAIATSAHLYARAE